MAVPWLLALVLLAVFIGGCGHTCTAITYNAIGIRVRDARSGELLCDADVKSTRRGASTEMLSRYDFPDGCSFLGGSSKGTYNVEVRRDGYLPASIGGVEVEEDECGRPITESRTLLLEPDPNALPPSEVDLDGGT